MRMIGVIASALELRRAENHREISVLQAKEKWSHFNFMLFLFLPSVFSFCESHPNLVFDYTYSFCRGRPFMSLCNLNFGRLS